METRTEHTQGPWICEHDGETYDRWNIIDITTDHGDVVAEIPKTGDAEYDTTVVYAHARLIAAAPELLEACKAIAALADGQGRANLMECAGQARNAIAKAQLQ